MRIRDPKIRDPGTQDPRPRDSESRARYTVTPKPRTWDPRNLGNLVPGTLNFFIELQNKKLKSNKLLTSKCNKAKYIFTFFSYLQITGVKFVSEIFRKILDTLDFCFSDLSR